MIVYYVSRGNRDGRTVSYRLDTFEYYSRSYQEIISILTR